MLLEILSLSLYIYTCLVDELGMNTPVEEHRPAEEAAAPAHDDMASAMKQDKDSLASVDQVAVDGDDNNGHCR